MARPWTQWLLAVALLVSGCRESTGESPGPLVGKTAPTVSLETLDHRRFHLRDHRGKPVVLLFWNTSCQVCKREMVELEKLRSTIGAERVIMATILSDPENIDLARRMVQGLKTSYPTLLDRGGRITSGLKIDTFPTTMVITPDGKIGFMRQGFTEPLMEQLRKAIEGHL
jgi:cytochrome c biogenesis protein CcmG/thiol:disulfide interchange protein DsbE